MRAVGIKVLKNKLSEYVRLAEGGEVVLVTDRDRVVAEMGPPTPSRSGVISDALLADLVRKGWLTPAPRPGADPPARHPIAARGEVVGELRQDRDGR
jgi:antitoxin (DNA-binding transcriptional repressor) of toxin-antitoxin stability system